MPNTVALTNAYWRGIPYFPQTAYSPNVTSLIPTADVRSRKRNYHKKSDDAFSLNGKRVYICNQRYAYSDCGADFVCIYMSVLTEQVKKLIYKAQSVEHLSN
ncbi:Piso0_004869 [Millerozyma farinosa CBS 7064]|uniref:Piso0_004869 protein n=1 Tax=Pichia sorbitophila (strain ATCC MYA-4447 / BCRC 22081 / CBS 7064 / NBRC 10061 / NRRL Y-12695) TaxID=559304 RepID=G8Y0N0_PICSO|nr:Piso0_004869 [Millerozyma farinosa CBS 7064]